MRPPRLSSQARLRARRLLVALLICLATLELCWRFGVIDTANENLRRLYYAVRGQRGGPTNVVFVAIDHETVEAWGRPPWTWERYGTLVRAIDAGNPRAIAVLEPGPRLLAEDLSSGVPAELEERERLVLPPLSPGLGQPRVVADTRGVVREIHLRDLAGPNTSARALAAAGFDVPPGGRLAVNYAGSPTRFPTVPAHRVADGEIPPSTFDGRIAVIGLRGESFAPLVPTPVGAMSPAEVHAHALLAASQGATWSRISGLTERLLCAGLVLVALLVLPRFRHGSAALVALALGASLLLIDYLLFSRGDVLFGATAPAASVLLAAVAAIATERHIARGEVEALARALGQRLSVRARDHHAGDSDEQAFERFAAASRIYVDFQSTALLLVPDGGWRLRDAGFVGMTSDQIVEKRRDIRRDPFKRAYASLRPTWSERPFMSDDLDVRTLIVPLVTLHRLRGVWIVNVASGTEPEDSTFHIMQALAGQFSLSLQRRRLARFAHQREADAASLDGLLVAETANARRLVESLAADREQLFELLEWLPVGVLLASVSGEIDLANEAMRRFVRAFGIEDVRRVGLVELLSRITGDEAEVARDLLRKQLLDQEPVELRGRVRGAASSATGYVLRLVPMASSQEHGDLPAGFVASVSELSEAAIAEVEWRWTRAGTADAPRVDVRTVLRRVIDEIEQGTTAEQPLVLELPERAPRALIGAEDLAEVVARILAEVRSAGAGEPGWVRVTHDADAVIVRIEDPSLTLPRDGEPEGFERARRLLRSVDGTMEVSSDLDQGTSVVIRIPRADP